MPVRYVVPDPQQARLPPQRGVPACERLYLLAHLMSHHLLTSHCGLYSSVHADYYFSCGRDEPVGSRNG